MKKHKIKFKETIATIISDEAYFPVAEEEIIRQRGYIENYIRQEPRFCSTLEPLRVANNAPEIVKRMAEATEKVGAGPMAAVAGAISEFTLRAMIKAGATHAIVDNGGDIAMAISQPVTVGIFTGSAKINNIGLRFHPREPIIGVCTSSGTIGHSLSFGRADAATVIARDTILADATATILCNSIKTTNVRKMEKALQSIMRPELDAMVAIIDNIMCSCGNLPEVVNARLDFQRISR